MQIVVSGSIAIDQIMSFDGSFSEQIQPDKLHNISISTLVEQFRRSRGGTGANICYNLALLGEQPVLFAVAGKDSASYVGDLESMGINTNFIQWSELPTASFSVLTDKDNCQVGGFYPGAMADADTLRAEEFKNTDCLFVVSPHDIGQMSTQVEACKKHSIPLVYDVGQQVIAVEPHDLQAALQAAQILIVNDYELGLFAKRCALSEDEVLQSVPVCIVTLGEKGSAVYSADQNYKKIEVPAVPVTKVVDPTGAGDAYRAGFLYGYVRNWSLQTCAQLASTVAAYAVEHLGTQEHNFTQQAIQQRYQAFYQSTIQVGAQHG